MKTVEPSQSQPKENPLFYLTRRFSLVRIPILIMETVKTAETISPTVLLVDSIFVQISRDSEENPTMEVNLHLRIKKVFELKKHNK